jgi:plasmid stabilization system protein ParE
MPARIRWSQPAEHDLCAMLSSIAMEDLPAAKKIFSEIIAALEKAAISQKAAKPILGLGGKYAELQSVRPFRIIYRTQGAEMLIISAMRLEQDFDAKRFMYSQEQSKKPSESGFGG